MKKTFLQATLLLSLGFGANIPNALALTDEFYASGEDLEFMFEINSDYALEEIEYSLREFVLYRKLEDLLFDFNDEYQDY